MEVAKRYVLPANAIVGSLHNRNHSSAQYKGKSVYRVIGSSKKTLTLVGINFV